ncbi:hypothetical protein FVE85_4352 [Porphyridium purpureum]|uniref:Uncharacterized protein n=1 Tax=Porphyridium purpureum TaxID=35688 RepID=A0A5J4YH07_PORPP|nr:hypothetical protein FVE85_4352 [Porphyridium purpureum]|eukprot:POR2377..scf270_19
MTPLNRKVRELLESPDRGLVFVPLQGTDFCIRAFGDASYATNADKSSQMGVAVFLGTRSGDRVHPLVMNSNKTNRVTYSVLGAELLALCVAFDWAESLQVELQHLLGADIPISLATDSQSLFSCIASKTTLDEKRLMIRLLVLREGFDQRHIDELALVPGRLNVADPLTKLMRSDIWTAIMTDGILPRYKTSRKEFADGVFCSRAKSTWFRERGKEAVPGRHVPVTSSALFAAWPRTSVGEQLLELRVSAKGLLQLPSGKEIEAVEKQLGAAVAASKDKVTSVLRVDQQLILELFRAARWTYNHCVALLNSPEAEADRRSSGNTVNVVQYLRSRVVNNGSNHVAANPWLRSIPHDIRDGACADAIAAFQACRSNVAAGNTLHFRLGFRSRKAHKSQFIFANNGLSSMWTSLSSRCRGPHPCGCGQVEVSV